MLKNIRLVVIALAMTACTPPQGQASLSREEAIALARAHAKRDLQSTTAQGPPHRSWESEKALVVKFSPDPQAFGGTYTVVIDKRNKEVVVAFAEQ